jgi:L-arabinose transport system substrate-binding protein
MYTAKFRASKRNAILSISTAIAVTLALAACTSGQSSPASSGHSGGKTSGALTISYLQNQGDQQYFVDQAAGAEAEAKKLGNVKIQVVDLGGDANKTISSMDLAVSQKVNGIIIAIPDQKLGPQVATAAANGGIPLLASDSPIKAGDGSSVPFVGFDGVAMGKSVGKEAAKLYTDAGWKASDTRIISAYQQDLSVCTDRANGAKDAFDAAVGSADSPKIVTIGTDNSVTDAQDKAGAVITANAGVKHWVVWGCNDENETGVVTALQNSGVDAANIDGVGLGAYLTCKDWAAGQKTGNKAALFISGYSVGQTAVKAMVAKVRNGTALPPASIAPTKMVDSSNWKSAGVVCT